MSKMLSKMNLISVVQQLPKEDIETIQGYVEMIEEENQELKKQLEVSNEVVTQGTLTKMKLCDEVNRLRKEYQDTYKDVRIEIKEYKTQQKEFIEFLEDKIKFSTKPTTCILLKSILQNYKKIIGVSDENNIK